MKRKNIDAMREVRLWIGQVVVPGIITLGAVAQIPGVKENASQTVKNAKEKVTSIFKKES